MFKKSKYERNVCQVFVVSGAMLSETPCRGNTVKDIYSSAFQPVSRDVLSGGLRSI